MSVWLKTIVRQFDAIPPNPSESDFLGAYNKLLNFLFPPESDFVVVPLHLEDPYNAGRFISSFEVRLVDKPVLILQLKSPSDFDVPSKRRTADKQIRVRMVDFVHAEKCALKTIYGVSALGTKLCFYTAEKDSDADDVFIMPIPIPHNPAKYMTDTAPQCRWRYDILDWGGQELQQIVKLIKEECEALEVESTQ